MSETRLSAALDELVDPCFGARGDWSDVLRRAGVASGKAPSRIAGRTRRIAVVAFALLALTAAVLVSTGFGRALLGRIDVDFGTSERAPQVVRWRFEDLAIGRPPGMGPQAIASQARTAGTLTVGERKRSLWVAPTRRGGFCFELEDSWGMCTDDPPARGTLAVSPAVMVDPAPGAKPGVRILGIHGIVYSDGIERLTVEFGDGETEDLDFVYVSPPIDAGLFSYAVPATRQSGPTRPRALVARDASGDVVTRRRLRLPPRQPLPQTGAPPASRPPSARRIVPPRPPFQTGEAHGVVVTAGSNAAVVFDATRIDPERRALLEGRVGYGCFQLIVRGGVEQDRAVGRWDTFGLTFGVRTFGLEPLDGCEIQGSYGHRWPDKLDSHSVIEIPFTEAGRRYFADRAAARSLALFVRAGGVRRARLESTAALASWLRASTDPRVVELPSRSASPQSGKVGYRVLDSSVVFRRVSATGRVFEVVVGPEGGIASENVAPLALVF